MKTFQGFELRTVRMFGPNTYWYGIRGNQAMGSSLEFCPYVVEAGGYGHVAQGDP